MNKTIKLVADNPFRVLGIFSNGSLKDLKANASRLNAYMKVGKTVEFPTDLSALMGNVERNADIVTDATSQINLPKDKLKYALFWFAKGNNIDEIAFNNLAGGDMDKAEQLFRKKTTYSSLINRGVLKFIQGDSDSAIQLISQVVYDETYRKDFVSAICDDTFSIEEDELSKMFIDSLLTAFDGNKLYSVFKDINSMASEYLIGISSQTHIDYINNEISKANSAGDDSEAQYEAGLQLMENTKEPLKKLKGIFGVKNFRYQQIADSLSKTILQCGIGYYNETDDDDYVSIDKAMKLQKYATDIAVGGITKERCQKNLAILEKKKKDLPPKEVAEFVADVRTKVVFFAIKKRKSINDAISLIQSLAPSIVAIKEELGSSNEVYLQNSSAVAKISLDTIIDEVNRVQEDDDIFSVRRSIEIAWKCILFIEKLGMFPGLKEHLDENKSILRNIASNIGVRTYGVSVDLDMRTEKEIFNSCKSITSYKEYIDRFPNGKYVSDAREQIENLMYGQCNSIADYKSYLKNYPNGKFLKFAKQKVEELQFKDCNSLNNCKVYLKDNPNGSHKKEVQDKLKYFEDLEEQKRIAEEARKKREAEDYELWKSSKATDTIESYERYLYKFPNGLRKKEAEQAIEAKKQTRTILIVFVIIVLIIIICNLK